MLKDVGSLSLVFSRGESEFENFTLSVCPSLRVCVCVGGVGGGESRDNVLDAVNCVYVCLILLYSQNHAILNPCFPCLNKLLIKKV